MTVSSLIAALSVGVAIGLCGRWLVPAKRRAPLWVAVSVGVGAALLGTIVGRLAGADGTHVGAVEIVLQVGFAAAAVALAGAAGGATATEKAYDQGGMRR